MTGTFGRYEVRGEIGRGGMATVYRAWDPRFNREVAIKVLPRALGADPTFRARFEREARAIASLEHHAIVPVYDFGEEGEDLYLVMRVLPGGSLADRIAGSALSLPEVTAVVERIAAALDYAHSRGVVHRDVKPANILFDEAGHAYLSDFGVALIVEQTASLTGAGPIGSPHYMSPEQAQGTRATPASDVYSLGCTVYEALAGQPPFSGDNAFAVAIQHVQSEVPGLGALRPDLPESVAAAVAGATAKAPEARFETAAAFLAALGGRAGTSSNPAALRTAEPPGPQDAPTFIAPVTRPPATASAPALTEPTRVVTGPGPRTDQPTIALPASPATAPAARAGALRRVPVWAAGLGGVVAIAAIGAALYFGLADGDPKGVSSSDPRLQYMSLSAGATHTCGVRNDGSVACWGKNDDGQSTAPGGAFTSVSAGASHTCGIKRDGTAACWGQSADGQSSPPPGAFSSVSAGWFHSCGVRTEGTLACWGSNGDGRASPPDGAFSTVSSGLFHSCGLRTDGRIACWGDNADGRATPPEGIYFAVSAGSNFTCAIVREDGTAVCWGMDAGSRPLSPPPGSFAGISSGGQHTCGRTVNGGLACWGLDTNGQASPPGGAFNGVAAGSEHSCGLRTDGRVVCWGLNDNGQASPP